MAMRVEGKVAVVTGARQGIGLALARGLLSRGAARVVMSDAAPLSEDVLSPGERARASWQPCDVTREADVAALAGVADGAQLVFSNAGINRLSGLLSANGLAAARSELDVNYLGTLRVIRALLPVLRRQSGDRAIVITGSALAEAPELPLATYCISKAATGAMAEILRAELAEECVQVMIAKPGAVMTSMTETLNVPKIGVDEAADEILTALELGASEVWVGPEAKERAIAIATDRAGFFRALGKKDIGARSRHEN